MMYSIPFPIIDPIAIQIGPIAIRWYALAYIAGLILGWKYCVMLARRQPYFIEIKRLEDVLVWAALGVILGGRLGYVLFYKPVFFLNNPIEIFTIWHGGMSFHGGLIGVMVASLIFAKLNGISILALADCLACATPIGLFFGRLANFINGELVGRVTDVRWGIIFPHAGPLPRHPSQIYEAGLEGIVLFTVLSIIALGTNARKTPGLICGIFILGYGITRSFAEMFRAPDAHIGYIFEILTMGQILSFPMIVAGIVMVILALKSPKLL